MQRVQRSELVIRNHDRARNHIRNGDGGMQARTEQTFFSIKRKSKLNGKKEKGQENETKEKKDKNSRKL